MKSENKDKQLDSLISKAIDGKKMTFDFEQWKQDHPKQIAAYEKQTAGKPYKLIKYAGTILSAAAMIFLAVMLLPTGDDGDRQPVEYQAKILTAKILLPANAPTVAKLNLIFQNYDLEAIDKFCEQAARRIGPRPKKMTARQLLDEIETNSNETKGNNNENSSYNNTDNISNAA